MKTIKTFEEFKNYNQDEELNEAFLSGLSKEAEKFAKWAAKMLYYTSKGKVKEPEGFDQAEEVFLKYYQQKGVEYHGDSKIPAYILKETGDKKLRNKELTDQYNKFKDKIEKKEEVQGKQQKSLLGGPGSRN